MAGHDTEQRLLPRRWVPLAIKDDETEASAVAFFEEALRAFSGSRIS
jgi:hypothetical protein